MLSRATTQFCCYSALTVKEFTNKCKQKGFAVFTIKLDLQNRVVA